MPYDRRKQLYNATTYNLVICNKFKSDQILTGDEENDVPIILYDSDDNNYYHANYQGMLDNKDKDPPRQC